MTTENKKDMSELNQKGEEIVRNVQEDLMSQDSDDNAGNEMDSEQISKLEKEGDEIVKGINSEIADEDTNAA